MERRRGGEEERSKGGKEERRKGGKEERRKGGKEERRKGGKEERRKGGENGRSGRKGVVFGDAGSGNPGRRPRVPTSDSNQMCFKGTT